MTARLSLPLGQALAWRAGRQHLRERAPRSQLLEVVDRLCGLHAQVLSSAVLQLWVRVEDLEPDAVDQALWEDRSLVKTWAMRGTLHLLPAAEYPRWQAALGTYRHYLKGSWLRGFGFTAEELERFLAAVAAALEGRMLTRAQLVEEVARLTGSPDLGTKGGDSFGATLKPASFRGHLCFAPDLGRNVRFTQPRWWLGDWPPVAPDVALTALARRYLAAYGPATREDFGRWWAVSPAQAQKLLERLGEEATRVEVDGVTAWMLADDVDEAADAERSGAIRLLPGFDPWVIGASRDALSPIPAAMKQRVHRPQGWISPVLTVDGCVTGTWNHERKGERVLVTVAPFSAPDASVRSAVEAEADRLAAFLGGRLDLRWEPG